MLLSNLTKHNELNSAVLYENEDARDDYIIKYIEEGLKNGDFCVVTLVKISDSLVEKIETNVEDYFRHAASGNILLVELSEFYSKVLNNENISWNSIFTKLFNLILESKRVRIRIASDFSDMLCQLKFIQDGIVLEEFWHRKNFSSSICLFRKNSLDGFEKGLVKKLMKNHNKVIEIY